MTRRVRIVTSEELRAELFELHGWTFTDADWADAYRWSLEGRNLTWAVRENGTVFAAEILE